MRLLRNLIFLAALGLLAFWLVTKPQSLGPEALAGLNGDATHGQEIFTAAGCASCHMAEGAKGEEKLILKGGQKFASDFGVFLAPNISQDVTHGIGAWSALDLANALKQGVSKSGAHLYPALPYAAYSKMALQDIVDLHAYLKTLPADATPSQPHEVSFPFNQRFLLGGWKFLFLKDDWVMQNPPSPEAERGRYIVEALAHCAECHTPRNALGGLDEGKWLSGVPNPNGKGGVPDITPAGLGWDKDEIIRYLTTGFTPDYDSVGGHMAHVVDNFGALPEQYASDVAAYLLALPQ